MSELLNVSGDTVRRAAKELYPYLFEKGKKTIFNKEQSIKIGDKVRKQGYIQPMQNAEVLPQNAEVVTRAELKEFAIELVKSIIKEILPVLKTNYQDQKMIAQDYFSILGFCNFKNIKITFSEAVKMGKCATRLSNERNIEIRNIPDERFGQVHSYFIDILQEIFSL